MEIVGRSGGSSGQVDQWMSKFPIPCMRHDKVMKSESSIIGIGAELPLTQTHNVEIQSTRSQVTLGCCHDNCHSHALSDYICRSSGDVTILATLPPQLLLQANDVELNPGPTIGGAGAMNGAKLKISADVKLQKKKQDVSQLGRLRTDICTHLNYPTSEIRKYLTEIYKLTWLTAVETSDKLELYFYTESRDHAEKLVNDCRSKELERQISTVVKGPKSDLKLTVDENDVALFLAQLRESGFVDGEGDDQGNDQVDSMGEDITQHASASTSQYFPAHGVYVKPFKGTVSQSLPVAPAKSTPTPATGPKQQPASLAARTLPAYRLVPKQPGAPPMSVQQRTQVSAFSVINKVVIELLKNKKHTEYDLHSLLKKHSNDIVPLLMLDENGHNMIHQCVQQNRIQLLKVFLAHGYWADLIQQEVPRQSQSEFATCTPKQMAERKRLRRLVREIDRLSTQEKSTSDKNAALRACRTGNLHVLQTMASTSVELLKVKDSEGNNGVHWAAVSGNLEVVKYLVGLGIRPNVLNENKQTALHVAVTYGQSQLIEFLVKDCRLDPTDADSTSKTPLQRTAENGDVETLSELLKCNVDIDHSLTVTAAQYGRHRYLERTLKDYGMDPFYKNLEGKTCLMIAVENGHLKIVEFLLNEYEYKLDDVSKQNRSVFHYAADKGHADVAKFLLDRANALIPDILNRKDFHHVEQLCSLVRGVDKGRSAWHYVHLKRKYVHLFQKCTKGGKVDASRVGSILQSGWGQEPEMDALKKCVVEYRRLTRTHEGEEDLTTMMLAVAKGHPDVAMLYIEAGADVHTRDCFKQTGMHLCAMRGSLEVAAALENRGLELGCEDEEDDQPVEVAEANEHPELLNFFRGKEHDKDIEVFRNKLPEVAKLLSQDQLREVRQQGDDVIRHVVRTVRELHIDINILLKELGSGPVLEESRAEDAAGL